MLGGMNRSLSSPPHSRLDVRPTARERRWFAQIDRHGPQSSEFLYEVTRDTHRCKDTALRRLQALREAGYLRLPPQQRQIAKADFNPYIYDLTKLGWDCLADQQELEKHCRPTGHWWHGYWVAVVTGVVELMCARAGLRYVPAAHILMIKNADLAIPVAGAKLIPDQLFAVRHADGFRAYALEVDRGTEPIRSTAARKSIQKSVSHYGAMMDQKLHQQHYGLKSNMLVLWLFNSLARERQFQKLSQSKPSFRSACLSAELPRTAELMTDLKPLFRF